MSEEPDLVQIMKKNPYFGVFPWHPINRGLAYSDYDAMYSKDPRKKLCLQCGEEIPTSKDSKLCEDCERCIRLDLQREKLRKAGEKIRAEIAREKAEHEQKEQDNPPV